MRRERLIDLLHFAILLRGRRSGISTGDICKEFPVSRRTAKLPAQLTTWLAARPKPARQWKRLFSTT